MPKGSGRDAVEPYNRVLEIKYQAIDGTVSVGGKTYHLDQGNMFVIRMTEDWTPVVSQIEVRRDEQKAEHRVLGEFKSVLRYDASIQQLELN